MIVGAICARGGSKGIRRKNLRELAGLPLIAHTIKCALACPILDRVVVSTEDSEIAGVAESFGAEVPFLRPAALATDEAPKWHVFQHLATTLEEMWGTPLVAIVDLDTGVPLRIPGDVTASVEQLLDHNADVVITAYSPERNPYFNMVELDGSGRAHIAKPSASPITRRQDAPSVYSLSPSVFAINRRALVDYSHWSEGNVRLHIIPRERAVDVDTEMDFRVVACLMRDAS